MSINDFERDQYFSITELPKVLGVSFNTVINRIGAGEIAPDFTHPVTGRKYFEKKSIEEKYLKAGANQMV